MFVVFYREAEFSDSLTFPTHVFPFCEKGPGAKHR